jgi:hypothetical protein
MSTHYQIEHITPQQKDDLFEKYHKRILYTNKAEIYGCGIKLLTENPQIKNWWEDNFYAMSENTRSHARLVVLQEPNQPQSIKYDPYTKTAFLVNIDYYGWIKSIALALAGDVLEDEHHVYSVHGAAIDVNCMGVSIIAPSGTGKTTHSWGLLRLPTSRLVADDWYFVRLSTREPLAFGSEKNCYVDADIGKIWNEYEKLIDTASFDQKCRAVVNVRWIVGSGGVIPLTTLKKVILLKRDKEDKTVSTCLNAKEALDYVVQHDFCNPHQLVRDKRKFNLRKNFFRDLFRQTDTYLVNTAGKPQQTQSEIRERLNLKR